MIEFHNVSFSYDGRQVLEHFSLKVNDGGRVCLYGNSGIGKTTVLRLILGLEKVGEGTVVCTDKTVSVVFQEDRLLPFKTLEENIFLFGSRERSDYILSALGIDDVKNKYPSQLSGGMSRRAAIARALCVDADVYIFDEPFTGLDEDNINRAVQVINEMTKGKTVIAVVHDRSLAQRLNCEIINI